MTDSGEAPTLSPLLRWAGGKRWLVNKLPSLMGMLEFPGYHEPFLGGASIFLGLRMPPRVFLSDLNAELIHTYEAIRTDPSQVARFLEKYGNSAEVYYEVRSYEPIDPFDRAARFVFLNHTSFNGIYRVNLNGVYNVPYGHRKSPQIPSEDQLQAFGERLEGAVLTVADFAESIVNVRKGDLVFLDPPYTVAHNQNGFVKYNQHLFSFEDQRRLSVLIDRIKEKGAYYIMTNAAHPSIRELFEKNDRRIETSRRNSIGGTSANRGSAVEYLFTNVPEA